MKLICTGDSQTAERLPLVPLSHTYGALIAARKGWEFSNRAVPSAKTSDWLAVQIPPLLTEPPACVTVMIGVNDGWIDPASSQPWPAPPLTPTQTQANIESGIQQLLSAGHQVTLFTGWAMWQTVNLSMLPSYIRAQKAAAIAKGVQVLDAYAIAGNCWLYVQGSAEYQTCVEQYTDGVLPPPDIGAWSHPAKAGHVVIAALYQ